ncbi:MAG: antibiotic biosynthesis monooxygenase [Alphaproteobacteria bacterium]|nr:antibiotic biosynthesis monooxygenase [Alphaproteobacteria bacterium]
MIVVVIRSRVRVEFAERYYELADRMGAIARAMPGFISWKSYQADDGERLSIHEWESAEQLRAWREHPEHVKVQALGKQNFYEAYTIYACDNPRTIRFKQSASAPESK